jgi:DNA-binding NarL/FixJ family response regulator
VPNQRPRRTATRSRVIRLVVVEQHALVRALLREIVGGQADIDIVAEAADIDDAIAIIRDETPDVVLVHAEIPISLMVPLVQRLKRESPGSPLVLLGHRGSDEELFAALQAGVAARSCSGEATAQRRPPDRIPVGTRSCISPAAPR